MNSAIGECISEQKPERFLRIPAIPEFALADYYAQARRVVDAVDLVQPRVADIIALESENGKVQIGIALVFFGYISEDSFASGRRLKEGEVLYYFGVIRPFEHQVGVIRRERAHSQSIILQFYKIFHMGKN